MDLIKCLLFKCNNTFKSDSQKNKKYCSRRCKEYAKREKNIKKFGWKRYATSKKGNFCERCNLIPEHNCQLEVDHIDGNRLNNCKENLQTLCANCHRLKTFLNEDYRKKY